MGMGNPRHGPVPQLTKLARRAPGADGTRTGCDPWPLLLWRSPSMRGLLQWVASPEATQSSVCNRSVWWNMGLPSWPRPVSTWTRPMAGAQSAFLCPGTGRMAENLVFRWYHKNLKFLKRASLENVVKSYCGDVDNSQTPNSPSVTDIWSIL